MLLFIIIIRLFRRFIQQTTDFAASLFCANFKIALQNDDVEAQLRSSDSKSRDSSVTKSEGARDPGATGEGEPHVVSESPGVVRNDLPPWMEVLSVGSTATIARIKPGVILKSPHFSWWQSQNPETHHLVRDIKHNFSVEERIFTLLGGHPRIVR